MMAFRGNDRSGVHPQPPPLRVYEHLIPFGDKPKRLSGHDTMSNHSVIPSQYSHPSAETAVKELQNPGFDTRQRTRS